MTKKDTTKFESQIAVLIIDDDELSRGATRTMCKMLLNKIVSEAKEEANEGDLRIVDVDTLEKGVFELSQNRYHIVFLDKDLGHDANGNPVSGIDHISSLLSVQPFTEILVYTGDLSFKEITRAIKSGATDYLMKSEAKDFSEYRDTVIRQAIKKSKEELKKAREENFKKTGLYSNYVCRAPAMQRFDQKLLAMAESSRAVLLLGATGLGKGAAARRISEKRANMLGQMCRPFIQENIGALPDNLAESTLFGTEPGGFTDAARKTKPGLLDLANDGDIFLDEIGDISHDLQKKLLKVVEEKEYYRVGGKVPIKTTARFIFATNKNLRELVEKGLFRQDFYMRLAALEEYVPSLEERKADIPEIIKGIIQTTLIDHPNKQIIYDDLPSDLVKYLSRDNIAGNIRGIENDLVRLIAYVPVDLKGHPNFKDWRKILGLDFNSIPKKGSDSVLELKHLEMLNSNFINKDFPGFNSARDLFEKRIFEEVGKKCRNIREAAKVLRLSNGTVSLKMREHKLKFARGNYDSSKEHSIGTNGFSGIES